MELTRKQVINTLETLKLEWGALAPPEDNICDALDYAISSLKTDEAYQIMYEGGEIFTKADMVAMLEELKLEFEKYEPKWAENEDQVIASNRTWDDFDDIIQQKIDALKEVKNAGRLAH